MWWRFLSCLCCTRLSLVLAVLLGQSSLAQLEQQLRVFKDSSENVLPAQLLWEIDRVHMRNRLPIFSR